MLKIEQFVEQQFGIKLTKHQLEIIAMIAASPENKIVIQNTGRSAGKTTAFKAAFAYLQDGLKEAKPVERKWWVTNKDAPEGSQRVVGPFTTATDAAVAREFHERKAGDHTFWLEELEP